MSGGERNEREIDPAKAGSGEPIDADPSSAADGEGPRRLSRRKLFGVLGGALLGVGGVVAWLRTRGYEMPPDQAAKLYAFDPWQYIVIQHAARRIAAPDSPDVVTPDEAGVAAFIDAYVARMPDALRRDVLSLVAYVEHLAPLAAGMTTRFTKLGPEDQDRVLAAMESSPSGMLRGGFDGLKSLVFMGYYRDPRTWKILGYAGPWVGRPEKGWW